MQNNYTPRKPQPRKPQETRLTEEDMTALLEASTACMEASDEVDACLEHLLEKTTDRALSGRLLAFYRLACQIRQNTSLLYVGVRAMSKEANNGR